MTDPKPIVIDRYVGDDWTVGPITLTAGGRALDLTGATVTALVYATDTIAPVATLAEAASTAGGLTVAPDRTTGTLVEAWVARSITVDVKPQDRRSTQFPTRICMMVLDSRGRLRTGFILPFRPLDRRFDVPPAIAVEPVITLAGSA